MAKGRGMRGYNGHSAVSTSGSGRHHEMVGAGPVAGAGEVRMAGTNPTAKRVKMRMAGAKLEGGANSYAPKGLKVEYEGE